MTKYLKMRMKSFENRSAIFVIILASILLIPDTLARANWPGFRGPTGLGYLWHYEHNQPARAPNWPVRLRSGHALNWLCFFNFHRPLRTRGC